jgi:PAS domain S-box-containing protein
MPAPSGVYEDEAKRLQVLEQYQATGLEGDPELDAIVAFAAKLCAAPVSLVSLVGSERQEFIAKEGVDESGTPRELSFCVHAMDRAGTLEIADATRDARFASNPLVTGEHHVRFYAGHPLVSEEGAPLGTLCVIDRVPREGGLTEFQREGLAVLAHAAMRRLRSRRLRIAAAREIERSEERFRALADSMPAIAFSADGAGKFDYFNRRWHEFTGFEGQFDEEASRHLLHPEEQEQITEKWLACVQSGAPYESENRLLRSDGQWRWVLVRAIPVRLASGEIERWFGTITDIDDTHKLSENRDMLAKELSHRIKNLFAVVGGLISLQARKAPEHKEFADQINETLRALGRAHDFVRPAGGATRNSLHGLLEVVLSPYRTHEGALRVSVSGADCPIAPDAATPFALVFHELATNSAKYGALSTEDGVVTVAMEDNGDDIIIHWREQGGPETGDRESGTGTEGFGSRMVDMAVTGQLQGRWERRFAPGGLAADLVLPKDAIAP